MDVVEGYEILDLYRGFLEGLKGDTNHARVQANTGEYFCRQADVKHFVRLARDNRELNHDTLSRISQAADQGDSTDIVTVSRQMSPQEESEVREKYRMRVSSEGVLFETYFLLGSAGFKRIVAFGDKGGAYKVGNEIDSKIIGLERGDVERLQEVLGRLEGTEVQSDAENSQNQVRSDDIEPPATEDEAAEIIRVIEDIKAQRMN